MPIQINIETVTYPTRGAFRISRSSVEAVHVVQVTLRDGEFCGRGECRPYARYGDTTESVSAQLEAIASVIESGTVSKALDTLPAGPARNALASAWVDLRAKRDGRPAWDILGVSAPLARETAFTLSWDTAEVMAQAATDARRYPWLKLKIGADGVDRVQAVAKARPDAKLIIDANEALTVETLPDSLAQLSGLNITLIEQPLPAGHEEALPDTDIIICADEGLHGIEDLELLWAQGYRAVNVKLDKCGGPDRAVELIQTAKQMGFEVMAGCMVGSSLAMAPMLTLESLCDVIDLDGPLLLARDIDGGLKYDGATVFPPDAKLWG